MCTPLYVQYIVVFYKSLYLLAIDDGEFVGVVASVGRLVRTAPVGEVGNLNCNMHT